MVTRVLGLGDDPEVDIFELAVSAGDVFLLASDGLFNEVDHHVLATILDNVDDLDEAATRLVERANQNGGNDNITVVIGRVHDDEPVATAPASAAEILGTSHPDEEPTGTGSDDAGHPDQAAATAEAHAGDGSDRAELAATVDAILEDRTELLEAASISSVDVLGDSVTEDDVSDEAPRFETELAGAVPVVEAELDERQTQELPVVPTRRKNRMRAFVFAVCVLALLGLGIGGLVAYGRNAWFVETVGNEVVIHQGRPGGVLFIEPQAVQPTGIDINDLNPGSRSRVIETPVFSSLAEAEEFVEQLELSSLRTSE